MENDEHKPFLCDVCYKAYTSLDTLSEHRASEHQGNFSSLCCHCKEVFTKEEEINEHIQANSCKHLGAETCAQTDIDKKLQMCNMCDAAFTDLDSLISHKERHRKEQFFVCSKCKIIFTTEEELNNHLKNHTRAYSDITSCDGINSEDSDSKYFLHKVLLSETCSMPETQNDVTLQQQKGVITQQLQNKSS